MGPRMGFANDPGRVDAAREIPPAARTSRKTAASLKRPLSARTARTRKRFKASISSGPAAEKSASVETARYRFR